MNKTEHAYLKYLSVVFAILAVVYFLISFVFFVTRLPAGDEFIFMNDLDIVSKEGWIAGIEHRISIPYMILVYPFSFFMETIWALRIVNVLILIILFLYFLKVVKVGNKSFYFYLLFYLASVNFFFAGINDPLFIAGLVVFFTEVFCFIEKGKMNSISIAFTALVVSFFTRELILIYLPAVLLSFFVLWKNGFKWSKKMTLPLSLLMLFMLLNIPSVVKNHKLSYDNKQAPENSGVNWNQRQYLAQLWVNEGKIKNFSHPSWEETKAYLDENGPDSLPSDMIGGMTHNIGLTITEFFKDFFYSLILGFRQLGLLILFPFYFVVNEIFIKRKWNNSLYLPTIFIMITAAFSLVIISFMELRWLASLFIPLIVFYSYYSEKIKYQAFLIGCNYLILSAFSLYGLYKVVIRF